MIAEVAELVDATGSELVVRKGLEVRLFSSAPAEINKNFCNTN
jgi:hypothetical protein